VRGRDSDIHMHTDYRLGGERDTNNTFSTVSL
jgi:hypothetical protein